MLFVFLFSETFASLLVLLLIFWHLLLIELLECLRPLVLLKLWYLIYQRLFTEPGILVFFTNLGYMELGKGVFILLSHFLIVKDFELFWGTRLMRAANSGIPLIYIPLILRPFWYTLLEINKRKWNKTVWETESFICKLKSIKATFWYFKFLSVWIISL